MLQPVRHGGNIYATALEMATALAFKNGTAPHHVEVAEAIDIPLATLFEVFPADHSFMDVIIENALLLLYDQCVRTVVTVDGKNPVAQFEALSDAYIEWAWRHPREFRIIGMMPAEIFQQNPNVMRYERSIHELMLRLLTRAQQLGMLPESEDLQMLVAIAHTYAYGVASKMLLGDLARWAPGMEPLEAARMSMHIFAQKFMG